MLDRWREAGQHGRRLGFSQQGNLRVKGGLSQKRNRQGEITEAPELEDKQPRGARGVWRRFCQASRVRLSFPSMTSRTPSSVQYWPVMVCGVAGAAVFHFFGNANHGYIDTASLFYWWVFQWMHAGSETEHGWIIFGLSLWLFWQNGLARSKDARAVAMEKTTRKNQMVPARAAIVALLVGLGLHAMGFAAQQARISIVAGLIFMWGLLHWAGGRRWGEAAAFPLAFMVFAIPINALDSIGFWLRVWVVDASAALAQSAGIGVLRSGTQLLAPDGTYNYDVAAACSGLRSLTALAALSLLLGYINFRTWSRRGLMLSLCFPLVYLGNVARIIAIIFAAHLGGPTWGDRVHAVMGYGVFLIVLGGLMAGGRALARWWPENGTAEINQEAPAPVTWVKSARAGGFVAIGVAGLAAGEMFFLRYLTQLPAREEVGIALATDGKNPIALPAFIGTEWIGRSAPVTPIEREILPADTGYSRRNYVSLADPKTRVFLSIVLSGRDRTSIHRPELCLVAQGWTLAGATEHAWQFPERPAADFTATLLRVRREVPTARGKVVVPELVAYWFVGRDGVVASQGHRLALDAWNRVVHARNDRWAYVLMQTDATAGEPAALERMQTVLTATLPTFQPARPQR